MPRKLPRLDLVFASEASFALTFISRIEQAKLDQAAAGKTGIAVRDVEFSYELAFLRVFLAWEILLEQSYLRFACGYHHGAGQEPLAPNKTYHNSIANAELALLGGRKYLLWHNPSSSILRAQQMFSNSRFELVIASAQSTLEKFAAVRHRIAHAQEHAEREFDAATSSLTGKRYLASRPGRFLRDWKTGVRPPKRWIESISEDLVSLARQICS